MSDDEPLALRCLGGLGGSKGAMDIHISYHILVGGLEHLDYFSIDWK